ncbi:MAG: sulfotransferase [Actinomycetota bacterium]
MEPTPLPERSTASARSFEPGIVLAGAMRCGSTSIYRHLGAHPLVHSSVTKETHFFDLHHDRGWAWYEQAIGTPEPGQVVFEATPGYLSSSAAIERLAADLPDAQVILSLRDPVERAQSHYWLSFERGHETVSLAAAIDAELSGRVDDDRLRRYVHGSSYGPQLRHLFDHVDAERVHVVLFEEYRADPEAQIGELVASLGLPSADLPSPGAVNSYQQFRSLRLRHHARRLPKPLQNAVGRMNRISASYPELDGQLRRRLTEALTESTAETADLLGRDLSAHWPSAR